MCCVGDNIFTTFKTQVVLHSFIRDSNIQNLRLFIVPILGIPYILTNFKRNLMLLGMFWVQQCRWWCIYPVGLSIIIVEFCLVLFIENFIVLLFIWRLLIISNNVRSKINSGKLWNIRSIYLIHIITVAKVNIWVHLGFHSTKEHSKNLITIIDRYPIQTIGAMCNGPHVLSKIPTKYRSVALGFNVCALIIIIVIGQCCWYYDVSMGLWQIQGTLQFVSVWLTFIDPQDHLTVPITIVSNYSPPIVAAP